MRSQRASWSCGVSVRSMPVLPFLPASRGAAAARRAAAAGKAAPARRPSTAAGGPASARGAVRAARAAIVDGDAEPSVARRPQPAPENRGQDGEEEGAGEKRYPDDEDGRLDPVLDALVLPVAALARLELLAIAFEHRDDVVDGGGNAAGEVAGAEGRRHRVLDDQLRVQVGQRAFQPVADLDAHAPVVAGDEKQDAVILAGLAETPVPEQAVGIRLD